MYKRQDDDGLYLSSRGYFLSENFELEIDEKNLHLAGLSEDVCNFTTEHEKDLAGRFIKNFAKFTGNEAGKALVAAGPKL